MGHPDGAHTHGHGSGGSGGAGTALLAVLALMAAAAIAGPVIHAALDLLHVVLITAAVIIGLALAGGAALIAWRLRRHRAGRYSTESQFCKTIAEHHSYSHHSRIESRESQRRHVVSPQPPAVEPPRHVHLHLHGADADTLAAALRQAGLYGPGNEHPAIKED